MHEAASCVPFTKTRGYVFLIFLAEPGHQQLDHYKAARRRAAQRAQAAPLSVVRPRFARIFPSDPTPHGGGAGPGCPPRLALVPARGQCHNATNDFATSWEQIWCPASDSGERYHTCVVGFASFASTAGGVRIRHDPSEVENAHR